MLITYNLGCRNCLKGTNIPETYILDTDNVAEIQSVTEFVMMKTVEKWRNEDNHTCHFCGSSNVEPFDIRVDDKMSYNFYSLIHHCEDNGDKMFMLNIDKKQGKIYLNEGGSNDLMRNFIKAAVSLMLDTIDSRNDDTFVPHSNGNSIICITGNVRMFKTNLKVQRFRYAGFTKRELMDAIKSFIY